MQTVIKVLVAAIIIVAVTELSKRVPRVGGLILSLPLTSIIALVWLYGVERNSEKVAILSVSTFWFVLPSLLLFILLPLLLRSGLSFVVAMFTACGVTAVAYAVWPILLRPLGIKL